MRCNRHVSDFSSTIGVCASCLRERLVVLIAAQVEENRRKTEDRHRKSTTDAHHQQPPLVFPRSVSPYICRRSDDSSWHQNDRRFYSTPQLGPTFNPSRTTKNKNGSSRSKFSLLSNLFKSSRSEVSSSSDLRTASLPSTTSSPMSTSSSSRSSWLSYLISGRRKKHSRFDDAPPVIPRTNRRTRDRGMSPDPDRNFDDEAEDGSGSPSASGYSSESSQGWKKSAPQFRKKASTVHNRNVSGLAFCLSPLVRASPNSHRCQKDSNLPPIGFSGEITRKPAKSHLSTASSLCANRSRKLADFGRYNYNP